MDSVTITQSTTATQAPLQSFSGYRILLTVNQFAMKHPAFTPSSLRNLIFLAADRYTSKGPIKGNGLQASIVRVGRKVLLDEEKFFFWIDGQQTWN